MVAPLRVSEGNIHAFVKSQQDWVTTTSLKIKERSTTIKKLAPERYRDGVTVPLYGKQTKITLKPSIVKTVKIEFNQNEFNIFLPTETIASDNSQLIRLALISWMKNQALKDVKGYVDCHASTYNLYPRLIKIKTQKSRWGSCGIHNDINLNWLLILAPPEVFEYVVVHELCHIKERNHSSNFWRLVESHLPQYQIQRTWLKQHGSYLMQGL